MIKIAVCDDSSRDLEYMADAILKHFSSLQEAVELRKFSEGSSFLQAVGEHVFRPDIVFLDIQLSRQNGIDLAESLHHLYPACSVIFVSSFLDYALDVYRAPHSYFILKSQFEQRLAPALNSVLENKQVAKPALLYHEGSAFRKVLLENILYLERNMKKTLIYLNSGEVCECREKPAELLKDLSGNNFVQSHQSFFVNLDFVSQMTKTDLVLYDGSLVPISRRLQSCVREAFFESISKSGL